jgi:hypothetical protein
VAAQREQQAGPGARSTVVRAQRLRPRTLPTGVAFWVLAAIAFLVFAANTAASPLYRIYQAHFRFSATTLTAVFAAYILVLVVTLLVLGSLSDYVGRRRVIAAGLAAGAAAFPIPALTAEQGRWPRPSTSREARRCSSTEPAASPEACSLPSRHCREHGSQPQRALLVTPGCSSWEPPMWSTTTIRWADAAAATAGADGFDAAVNAAPGGAASAMRLVRDRGRLATITSDPPAGERQITITTVYVRADGSQLRTLVKLVDAGTLGTEPGRVFPAAAAPEALAAVLSGTGGQPVTLTF